MTDMTLTLPKADLLTKLTDRRDEVKAEFTAANITPLEDLIAEVKNAGDLTARMTRWHKKIAKGLADGSITVNPSGSLKGAPPKPTLKNASSANGSHRLGRHYYHYRNMSLQDLEAYLKNEEKRRDEFLKPLDTAIDLLALSTDSDVKIQSGDYQKLLSHGSNNRWY